MKDYTKYDFDAIVGAEVEITQKDGRKSSGTFKLVGRHNGAVLLYPSDKKKPVDWVLIKNIASLTAKIKVEDMSVKQLKKAFNLGTYEVLVFNEATGTIANRDVDGGELGHTYEELPFNDYIDCTDWGWKHE